MSQNKKKELYSCEYRADFMHEYGSLFFLVMAENSQEAARIAEEHIMNLDIDDPDFKNNMGRWIPTPGQSIEFNKFIKKVNLEEGIAYLGSYME